MRCKRAFVALDFEHMPKTSRLLGISRLREATRRLKPSRSIIITSSQCKGSKEFAYHVNEAGAGQDYGIGVSCV